MRGSTVPVAIVMYSHCADQVGECVLRTHWAIDTVRMKYIQICHDSLSTQKGGGVWAIA